MSTEAQLRRRLDRIDQRIAKAKAERSEVVRQLPRPGLGRPAERLPAAVVWLEGFLLERDGWERVGVIMAEGKKAGHAEKTLRRAGDRIGVLREPPGGGRLCEWMLPPKSQRNGKVRR